MEKEKTEKIKKIKHELEESKRETENYKQRALRLSTDFSK